jgi:hypothetical protein
MTISILYMREIFLIELGHLGYNSALPRVEAVQIVQPDQNPARLTQ